MNIPSQKESVSLRLESLTWNRFSSKNLRTLLQETFLNRFLGHIYMKVTSTRTVFSTLILVKSLNGLKCDTLSSAGG